MRAASGRRIDPGLAALVAEGFLSRLAFGLVSFALPLYAYRELGLGLGTIGVLLSFNLVVAVVLKPPLGALVDRFGLKPSLTAAIALRSAVSLLLVFAAAPWQLFGIRGVHGVSIALRDPAAAVLLAERGGKAAVASAFAWYQTAKSLAGAVGKASAGLLLGLTASNFSLVFLVAFALSALPVLVVARYVHALPEEEGDEARADAAAVHARPPRAPVLRFAGLGFAISGTASMLTSLFPIFAVEYGGLSEAQAGAIYLIAMGVPLAGPGFGWLADHVSRKLVLSVRGAANVLSSAIYLVAPSFPGFAVGRVVDDLGKAAFRPAWGSLMAEVAGLDRRRRARAMASMSAGEDTGEIMGPIVASALWGIWGAQVLLVVRIVLAVGAEVYTAVLTRSLGSSHEEPRATVPRGAPARPLARTPRTTGRLE